MGHEAACGMLHKAVTTMVKKSCVNGRGTKCQEMSLLSLEAGDIATGVAHRLFRCGYSVIMTELATPTVIRRQVAFAEVVYEKVHSVEGVTARLAQTFRDAVAATRRKYL